MTRFTSNQNMEYACLTERIIPVDITLQVVSICVALLQLIKLTA